MRPARKISNLVQFKASELRAWLLFYSLVALQVTSFPDKYYQHWILFVKALYILLQDKISESDLSVADVMLKCFLRGVRNLYSEHDYVYNVHQLSHFVEYVKLWGPLFATSGFPYEGQNGIMTRMVQGTKHQAKELVENLKLAHCIHILNVKVKNRADKVFDSSASVCGMANKIVLNDSDIELLRSEGVTEFETYRRAYFKNGTYTSSIYDENKKKCNSVVQFLYQGKTCTGQIICFVKTSGNILCYVDKFKSCHTDIICHRDTMQRITHLRPVVKSGEKVLVKLCSVEKKLLQVGNYIPFSPNNWEKNL